MNASAEELIRRIEGQPGDPAGWIALGRCARRTRGLPVGLAPGLLPHLVRAWREAPDERGLYPLFLSLAGFRRPRSVPRDPGRAWRQAGRVGGSGPEAWDTTTGLPFWVERPEDRRLMALVPGTGEVPPFYLDVRPVPKLWWLRFRMHRGEPEDRPPHHPVDCSDPVEWVDAAGSLAYARWVGARLPTEAEWERASGAAAGLPYPWGTSPPRLAALHGWINLMDHPPDVRRPRVLPEASEAYRRLPHADWTCEVARASSPHGQRGMFGVLWEWCRDDRGELILRGGSYRDHPTRITLATRRAPPRTEEELEALPRGLRLARGLAASEAPARPLLDVLPTRPPADHRRMRSRRPRIDLLELFEDVGVPMA